MSTCVYSPQTGVAIQKQRFSRIAMLMFLKTGCYLVPPVAGVTFGTPKDLKSDNFPVTATY